MCVLLPTSCFTSSIDTIAEYEYVGIGLNFNTIYDTYNNWSFVLFFKLMVMDVFIYLILILYLIKLYHPNMVKKTSIVFFIITVLLLL